MESGARNEFIFEQHPPNSQSIVHKALTTAQIERTHPFKHHRLHPIEKHTLGIVMSTAEAAFAMVDASFDQNIGRAGAGVALFASNGQLQLLHFLPLEAASWMKLSSRLKVALIPYIRFGLSRSIYLYIYSQLIYVFNDY
jgi:hypothetical protein